MTVEPLAVRRAVSEARECPEMLSTISEAGLEITQITTDLTSEGHSPEMPSYPVSYSADSRRLVFVRRRQALSGTPRNELTLCEIQPGFPLLALTAEAEVRGYVLMPDGQSVYYFVDESGKGGRARLLLKRINLAALTRETVMVVDYPVPGVGRVPRGGYAYPCASLSPDGRRIATCASFYTDDDPLFATLIFDLDRGQVHGFVFEPYNWRPFGLYTQSQKPEHRDHLMMAHSHQLSGWDVNGKWYVGPKDGIGFQTHHVVNEQGQMLASLPVGVDKTEGGPNHVTWRGNHYELLCHMSLFNSTPEWHHWRGGLYLCEPIACAPEEQYRGRHIPGGRRWDLTRHIKRPDCFHLATNRQGTLVVSDTEGVHGHGETSYLWLGRIPEVTDPMVLPRYLLHPHSSMHSYSTQPKPSITPDGRHIFFRSDWLCQREHPQLFVVTGYSLP